jgi:hypothetical protein
VGADFLAAFKFKIKDKELKFIATLQKQLASLSN